MSSYEIGNEVLGGWTIVREIGRGAFGRVFEVENTHYGIVTRAALKVVVVPPTTSEIDAMHSEGMDEASIASACTDMADELLAEVSLLASLGHPNIVHYQDHSIVAHECDPGCDVLMRMELLTSLATRMGDGWLTEYEIVRLGEEIADALAFCHRQSIVHRDVKPQNIFIDASGHYKLGDFGISRVTKGVTMTLSQKGTPPYMAPELVLSGHGDAKVDVYSLGIMLYQMLNRGRLPFYPVHPLPITLRDRQEAQSRRLAGEQLPAVKNCDQQLMSLVLNACAFDAHERPTAIELRDALRMLEIAPIPARLPSRKDEHTTVELFEGSGYSAKDLFDGTPVTLNIWDAFGTREEQTTVEAAAKVADVESSTVFQTTEEYGAAFANEDEERSLDDKRVEPGVSSDEKRTIHKKSSFVYLFAAVTTVVLAFVLISAKSSSSSNASKYTGEWYVPTDTDRHIILESNGEVSYGDDNHGIIAAGTWTVIDEDAGAIKLTLQAKDGNENMFEEGADEFTRLAYAESDERMTAQLYYSSSEWETYIKQQ